MDGRDGWMEGGKKGYGGGGFYVVCILGMVEGYVVSDRMALGGG